jgi:hypothetical protein
LRRIATASLPATRLPTVWGIDDPHEAAAQFKRQIERLVKVM